jgi:hypothetical protein
MDGVREFALMLLEIDKCRRNGDMGSHIRNLAS